MNSFLRPAPASSSASVSISSSSHSQRPALLAALMLALSALALGGCATVAPHERATLNDYTMRADRDKLHDAMTEHILFSREASSGGRGVGGGGCGCN